MFYEAEKSTIEAVAGYTYTNTSILQNVIKLNNL